MITPIRCFPRQADFKDDVRPLILKDTARLLGLS
jgi:hypothetical protein